MRPLRQRAQSGAKAFFTKSLESTLDLASVADPGNRVSELFVLQSASDR
ncbi:MAG: hypothetical protein ACI841_000828, partial [Planctomycetota bacterium]